MSDAVEEVQDQKPDQSANDIENGAVAENDDDQESSRVALLIESNIEPTSAGLVKEP